MHSSHNLFNQHSAAPLKIKRLAQDSERFIWALSIVQTRSFHMQMRVGALVQDANMLVPYAGNFCNFLRIYVLFIFYNSSMLPQVQLGQYCMLLPMFFAILLKFKVDSLLTNQTVVMLSVSIF